MRFKKERSVVGARGDEDDEDGSEKSAKIAS